MIEVKLSPFEARALYDAAKDGIERSWCDWLDTGEAGEMDVTESKLNASERALKRINEAIHAQA